MRASIFYFCIVLLVLCLSPAASLWCAGSRLQMHLMACVGRQTAIPVPGILSGFSVFSFQERTGVEYIALRRRAQAVGTAGTIRVLSYRKTPIPRETRVPLLLTHSGPSLLEWVFPNWLDRVGAIGPQK